MKLDRRSFLFSLAAGAGALALPHSVRAAEATIEIMPTETLAPISRNIYGHFVEHLGAVVYDGMWVGEESKIPNIGGVRKALIDALRKIKAPVFRYPGGCFADSYNWRDGVGPRAQRPRTTNFWYGNAGKDVPLDSTSRFEPNHFGTNEFLQFCRAVGGQGYLAANLRSLPAQAFNEWLEYCNSPADSTTLAKLRASGSAGSREPFRVEYWGIGNESWGCGGEMLPDEYAQEFRRFTAAANGYDVPLKFVGAGADSNDLNWTRGFFSKMREKGEGTFRKVHSWGVHHYSWNVSGGRTRDWNEGKGDALKFTDEEYFELLAEGSKLEKLLLDHWAVMGEYDTQHRVKFAVDEWGAWYRPGTEIRPTHILGQQNTMRDAVLAGITLDIFNRQSDKVVMANVAQLVNCLQSLFLADGDRFITTPTYHVFEMFMPHMDAVGVKSVFSAPDISYQRNGQPASLRGLNGSASIRGKEVCLTVTNPHLTAARTTTVALRDATIASATARVLSSKSVRDHNSFEVPEAVRPRTEMLSAKGSTVTFTLPPASVTTFQFRLS